MKKLIYILIIIPFLLTNCSSGIYTTSGVSAGYQTNTGARIVMGYETFYNELSPYGRWIDYPGEGYMWIPGAEAGFRPYATNGHWVYTNYGWTWVSNYNWGWAPFHYGRWMYDDGYGWMWLPGHEWAPAWVTWGQSGGYYGWAPLAPHISINVSIGGGWTPPQHYWNFVPAEHITRENINTYVVNNTTNVNVVNNITKNVTIINNNNITNNNSISHNPVVYNKGPMAKDVERFTNNRVQPVQIRESTRPGASSISNNELAVYHPVVKQYDGNRAIAKPVPAKVEVYRPVKNQQRPVINNQQPLVIHEPILQPKPAEPRRMQEFSGKYPGQWYQKSRPDQNPPAQKQDKQSEKQQQR